MSHHNNPESEPLDQSESAKSRRLSRLFGRAAISEGESGFSIERQIESLDKDLVEFEREWQTAEDMVHSYMDDSDTRELIKSAILDYKQGHGSEDQYHDSGKLLNQRRHASRMSEGELVDFIGAHVLKAQLQTGAFDFVDRAEQEGHVNGKDKISLRDIRESGLREKRAIDTADLRWSEIKGTTCEHTPNAVVFFDSVEKLGKAASKHYRHGAKISSKVLDTLENSLKVDKVLDETRALSLLDLAQDDEKMSTANPILIKLLASDYESRKSQSVLGKCLEVVRQKLESGALVTEFLDTKSEHNSGDNYINFLRKIVTDLNPDQATDSYLRSVMEDWPSDLKREHSAFAKSQFNIIQAKLGQFKVKHSDKRLIPVDADSVAVAMERLLVKIIGPLNNPYKGKANITPKEALQEPINSAVRVEQKEQLTDIEVLVPGAKTSRGQEYQPVNGDKLEQMKQTIIERFPHDKKLADNIDATLATIARDPHNRRASMSVGGNAAKATILLNGKSYSVHRFNPVQYPGLSLGERGKKLRVIYAVAESKLCILELLCDHQEYERALQKYK